MKIKSILLALVVTALALPRASAQVSQVLGEGFSVIVGGVPSANSNMYFLYQDWSTVPSGSYVSAGTNVTAGKNQYTYGQVFLAGSSLANASARATILGEGFSNDGTRREVWTTFATSTTNSTNITIWGPTLNNYGVVGARNFYWAVYSDAGGWSEGNGEAVVTGHKGKISVYVTPTYWYENGDVLVRADVP